MKTVTKVCCAGSSAGLRQGRRRLPAQSEYVLVSSFLRTLFEINPLRAIHVGFSCKLKKSCVHEIFVYIKKILAMVRPRASEENLRVALAFVEIVIVRERLREAEPNESRIVRNGPRSLFAQQL